MNYWWRIIVPIIAASNMVFQKHISCNTFIYLLNKAFSYNVNLHPVDWHIIIEYCPVQYKKIKLIIGTYTAGIILGSDWRNTDSSRVTQTMNVCRQPSRCPEQISLSAINMPWCCYVIRSNNSLYQLWNNRLPYHWCNVVQL